MKTKTLLDLYDSSRKLKALIPFDDVHYIGDARHQKAVKTLFRKFSRDDDARKAVCNALNDQYLALQALVEDDL